jgi:hypothetical protein
LSKQDLKARKARKKKERAKRRVLARRQKIRDEARVKKEIELIKRENEEKIEPYRKEK